MLRIGIDIGGCLSKQPHIFRLLIAAIGWNSERAAVYLVTDQHPEEKVRATLLLNGIDPPRGHVLVSDYDECGEECKAVVCQQHAIDILIDDHAGYLACVGEPLVRLLMMPDATRPYYHSSWVTPEGEGTFGRRTMRRNPPESKPPR